MEAGNVVIFNVMLELLFQGHMCSILGEHWMTTGSEDKLVAGIVITRPYAIRTKEQRSA